MLADKGLECFGTFLSLKDFTNSIFYCHIWNELEKCIQMSTNKPSLDCVGLKVPSPLKKKKNLSKRQFFYSKC